MLIVVCKKWHVAKRLIERIRTVTNVPAVEYLFNEEDTDLPDLGGIQSTLKKRTRHRRSLVRMLFDYYQTDRLLICMDPTNIELLQDFGSDRSVTKLLEIECQFSDDYLAGHAKRVGLAGDQTPTESLERLLPTIRHDMVFESDRIRDANFENHYRLRETAEPEENAKRLAGFLAISLDHAKDVTAFDHLFSD